LLLGVLAYRLIVDRGRLLLQLEALESRLGSAHSIPSGDVIEAFGFPPGSPAPDFALPDLTGTERALEGWRGRRLLLVFFDPDCRFCLDLLPSLESTRSESTIVVVATGAPDRIRALVEEHDLCCTVLLQQENEVSQLFRVPGTPAAYAVDENGLIAGPLTLGSEAVLDLAAGRHAETAPGATTKLRLLPLSESRLLRTGLEAGARAPLFTRDERLVPELAAFCEEASEGPAVPAGTFDVVHVFRLAALPYARSAVAGERHADLDDVEPKTYRRLAELHRLGGDEGSARGMEAEARLYEPLQDEVVASCRCGPAAGSGSRSSRRSRTASPWSAHRSEPKVSRSRPDGTCCWPRARASSRAAARS
jgi:peroxiredoxin